LKENIFFILNSAQDFFPRLASTATVQNLEIGPVRSLGIVKLFFRDLGPKISF
jgi:hypothetical protein